ncbi:hypothetical protein [Cohnella sp. WQ 127256]|nr:hypothetical protein [Cohnella sp. WQ 127256]
MYKSKLSAAETLENEYGKVKRLKIGLKREAGHNELEIALLQ